MASQPNTIENGCSLSMKLKGMNANLLNNLTQENYAKTWNIALLVGWFFLWYLFSASYNVANKLLLDELPQHAWTITTIQLIIGIPLFAPVWFYSQKRPNVEPKLWIKKYWKIAALHGLGNYFTTLSTGSGPSGIGITQTLKASEPVFVVVLSKLLFGITASNNVTLACILICVGVGIASYNDSSFTLFGFIVAMASNLCYSLRAVLAKNEMIDSNSMSPTNFFRILTLLASFEFLPFALFEISSFMNAWNKSTASGVSTQALLASFLCSGVSYYLYNMFAFLILDQVSVTSQAIGNALKRVIIILASVIFFQTPLTKNTIIGVTIAIGSTCWYSTIVLNSKGNTSSKEIEK